MAIDPVSVSATVISDVPPETVHALQPVADVISPMLGTVSWLLGGFFGLYLIFVVIKLYFDYRRIKLLRAIRDDVRFLKKHSFPEHSEKKKNKLMCSLCNIFKKKEECKPVAKPIPKKVKRNKTKNKISK